MNKIKRTLIFLMVGISLTAGIAHQNVYATATSSSETTKTENKFDMKRWIGIGIVFIGSATIMAVVTYQKGQKK